jgi:hypothetical protein
VRRVVVGRHAGVHHRRVVDHGPHGSQRRRDLVRQRTHRSHVRSAHPGAAGPRSHPHCRRQSGPVQLGGQRADHVEPLSRKVWLGTGQYSRSLSSRLV